MDRMHKGTAGEISRMLTKERDELAEKLSRKQQELLECRRHFADMGFRSDGKTLHPKVQRAVYFNDALIAAQKQRVEHEALLATIQTAVRNGEDLGQYMMSVGDAVGREMLLNSLGLGSRDVNTQASLEQNLIAARAELQTVQQNLGPDASRGRRAGGKDSADRAVPRVLAGAHQPARGRNCARTSLGRGWCKWCSRSSTNRGRRKKSSRHASRRPAPKPSISAVNWPRSNCSNATSNASAT